MVTIEIDGKPVQAEPGTMVIQAADAAGIYIPRFCYHRKLSVAANCRMCLVEVEKAPKPLPACATPVAEGMKVRTRSPLAVEAQRGTMEFLLINHPLDCPICDQGGECDLQDLAVGYGRDVSRYTENKRVVKDKDLGPLISTDMTRCIHCTRCVRFGQEVAGLMELGATGRGEHMEIGTYIEHSVDSELSGNMIDLCPVGALTSKPFRYTARTWELEDVPSVLPHDVVGSNAVLQTWQGEVKRVLPRENEAVNECWLSDRDRFSYEALNSEDRLLSPLLRENGAWRETDWPTALRAAAEGLAGVVAQHGPEQIGALASPAASAEEHYLLQRLMRGLGSGNVDHRLRQADFRAQDSVSWYGLGRSIRSLEGVRSVLLVGANLRKEQPMLNLRVRGAALSGARVMAINPMDWSFTFDLAHKRIVAPSAMPWELAGVVAALAQLSGGALASGLQELCGGGVPDAGQRAVAQALMHAGADGAIILGHPALAHPRFSELLACAAAAAGLSGASLGVLGEGNCAGAWAAGCLPRREAGGRDARIKGLDALEMTRRGLRGMVLLNVDPALDCLEGGRASRAAAAADFTLVLSVFRPAPDSPGGVWLPMAAFSETEGTFINCEGRSEDFAEAVKAPGEARPGWKIMRVLGNQLNVPGFDYMSIDDVRREFMSGGLEGGAPQVPAFESGGVEAPGRANDIDLERVVVVPPYRGDAYLRHAPALQATADNPDPAAAVNAGQAARLGMADGEVVQLYAGDSVVPLTLRLDERVPDGCVLVEGGYAQTAPLNGPGHLRLVRG
jgi:NADH-quinone oxidoreductase subunit G